MSKNDYRELIIKVIIEDAFNNGDVNEYFYNVLISGCIGLDNMSLKELENELWETYNDQLGDFLYPESNFYESKELINWLKERV